MADNSSTSLVIAAISLAGSFLTLIVTSLMTILGKAIDSQQKTNEHKLSIRSAYFTKKIEAGQNLIGKNNITIQKLYVERNLLIQIKEGIKPDEDFMERVASIRKVISEISKEDDDYTDLYFDTNQITKRTNILSEELTKNSILIKKIHLENSKDEYTNHLDKIIGIYNSMIIAIQEMNSAVRNELARYDIL